MNFPLLDVFLSMMFFFLFIMWFFLVFWVAIDIFKSHDLSGWGKAGWLALDVLVPFFGVLIYLIVRGHKIAEHGDVGPTARGPEAYAAYAREEGLGG